MVSLSMKGKRALHFIPTTGFRKLSAKQLQLIITQSMMTRQKWSLNLLLFFFFEMRTTKIIVG